MSNEISENNVMEKEYEISLVPGLTLLQPKDDMLVGYVINKKKGIVASIFLNEQYLKAVNMREMCVVGGMELPEITISTGFFNELLKKTDKAFFMIYHELGHLHLKNMDGRTDEDIRKERRSAIRKGRVCKSELEADTFAAQHLGVDLAIKALKQLKESRESYNKERGIDNQPLNIMALQEYDYRIKAMQELKEALNK